MAIVLDILRHGQALPAGPDSDQRRRLSPTGERALATLAARLARGAWRPDRVFSSPYVRALQSARIVARAAVPPIEVETLAALEPDRGPGEVLDGLARLGVAGGHVLVVGHQPLLGRLVGYLAGVETGLSPGTLVRVECPRGLDRNAGRIVLKLPPEDPGPG